MKLATDQSTADALRVECERAMHAMFAVLGVPKSYLDLGCRDGYMVRAARMFGCKPCVGQTASLAVKSEAKRYARLFTGEARGQYDLVTCIYSLPDNVRTLVADDGHLVIASAYHIRYGGSDTVNGLRFDSAKTEDLQTLWSLATELLPHYVQVYFK